MRLDLFITFLIALPGALAGCSGQGDACVTNADCFRGEVCADGFCEAPSAGDDVGANPDDTDNSTSNNGGDGDAGGVNGEPNSPDGSDPNNGSGGDAGGDDVGELPACYGDAFDECVDEEDPNNNSFPGAQFDPMTRGCQSGGFEPLDKTLTGRMCPLDPEDQYYLTIVECDEDDPGMVIEATLDVKDDCDEEMIWFDVESIGTSCAEPNPDSPLQLRCQTLDTGERQISVIFGGFSRPVVRSIRYSIQTPDRQDLEFDYNLRVVVREP